MSFRDKTAYWRRALWHARQGGMGQVKSYLHRSTAERDEASLSGVRGAEGAWRGLGRGRHLIFREAAVDVAQPRNPQLRVGIIMDDFSAAAFSAEWTIVALRPDSWEQQLRDEALDFVVVESAWAGNAGLWRGKITGPAGPSAVFLELVAGCRAAGLPAVFWNKEDPPHYEDFLPAAKLFDHVFTTDANMLPRYRADLGHDRISVLPFAAQPRIHNPARPRHGWHAREIAFAGMYFAHKYEDRRRQMEFLLGAAVDATAGKRPGFEIFSRQLGRQPQYQFPGILKKHVVGSLSYKQMLTAYKAYKVFLNVNSVTDSPSMCARRIFEITAAGSCVVSTPSAGHHGIFPGQGNPHGRHARGCRAPAEGTDRQPGLCTAPRPQGPAPNLGGAHLQPPGTVHRGGSAACAGRDGTAGPGVGPRFKLPPAATGARHCRCGCPAGRGCPADLPGPRF